MINVFIPKNRARLLLLLCGAVAVHSMRVPIKAAWLSHTPSARRAHFKYTGSRQHFLLRRPHAAR